MLVIIGLAVFFCFVIWRAASRRTVIDPSNTGWDELIHDPNTDESFRVNFNLPHFSDVAERVLKPLHTDYIKFMSNLFYVFYGGNPDHPFASTDIKRFSDHTPSIGNYSQKKDRPAMPLWFIAAFPDLLDWMKEEKEERRRILFEGIDEAVLQSWLEMSDEDIRKLELYKRMVENYLKKARPGLEIR